VFTDSDLKDLSVKATSTMGTVEQTHMHYLPKRRHDINNGVASTEKAEDEMSTEDRRQQIHRHLGRCVQRHQALLE
jgi:diadenosine tetraphosphate (Ap4A) HIT family hydrolase